MANNEHVKILKQGVAAWREWRKGNPQMTPDLSDADLRGEDLSAAYLTGANLSGAKLDEARLFRASLGATNLSYTSLGRANLRGAFLKGADLSSAYACNADLSGGHLQGAKLSKANFAFANLGGAKLIGADLREALLSHANFYNEPGLGQPTAADLSGANLTGAWLIGANLYRVNLQGATLRNALLTGANLNEADLSNANLNSASLIRASLVKSNFSRANLNGCSIFGVSAWGVELDGADQINLIITDYQEPIVMVDNLEVAQFVYLLLSNKRIRDAIDTIGRRAVLILGRFSSERKQVLDAIADKLRQAGFLPITFDFQKSEERDFTETIMTLAGLCIFVITDITKPRSNPLELQATVPNYMIPFVPLLQEGETPFSMFVDLQNKYHWVLPVIKYDTTQNLIDAFENAVIKPALAKHDELISIKAEGLKTRHVREWLSGAPS